MYFRDIVDVAPFTDAPEDMNNSDYCKILCGGIMRIYDKRNMKHHAKATTEVGVGLGIQT
jgi:hypothetical protein